MRKTPTLAALCATALTASPAVSALAPNYQRLAEIRAVIDNPGVTSALGAGGPVDRVEYVRTDLYRVTAGRCHVDAAIVELPVPRGMVGPRRFEVRPRRKVCR